MEFGAGQRVVANITNYIIIKSQLYLYKHCSDIDIILPLHSIIPSTVSSVTVRAILQSESQLLHYY